MSLGRILEKLPVWERFKALGSPISLIAFIIIPTCLIATRYRSDSHHSMSVKSNSFHNQGEQQPHLPQINTKFILRLFGFTTTPHSLIHHHPKRYYLIFSQNFLFRTVPKSGVTTLHTVFNITSDAIHTVPSHPGQLTRAVSQSLISCKPHCQRQLGCDNGLGMGKTPSLVANVGMRSSSCSFSQPLISPMKI